MLRNATRNRSICYAMRGTGTRSEKVQIPEFFKMRKTKPYKNLLSNVGVCNAMQRLHFFDVNKIYSHTKYIIGPQGRTHGPVCGQDPQFCESPASKAPNVWPDNLQKWPICHRKSYEPIAGVGAPNHVNCKLTARPCCIGIHGRCEMRSEEYCKFVKGYFHPEATLCSQVSCMQDVCGMLSFANEGSPDQFYRYCIIL